MSCQRRWLYYCTFFYFKDRRHVGHLIWLPKICKPMVELLILLRTKVPHHNWCCIYYVLTSNVIPIFLTICFSIDGLGTYFSWPFISLLFTLVYDNDHVFNRKTLICTIFCRYLPPEIGCLTCLEYLDLSHNKMKNLPSQIANLSALRTLKVSNNKLVQLPSTLSSLQKLENLDLSNNRLISLGSLELDTMSNLLILNIQVHIPFQVNIFLKIVELNDCVDV